jgi:hypothetical protein
MPKTLPRHHAVGIRPRILLLDAAPEESAPSATPSDNASCRRGRNPGPVRGPVLGGPALRTGVCTTHSSTNRVTAGPVLCSSRLRGSVCRLRLDGAMDQGAELAVDTTPRSRLFTVKAQVIAAEPLAATSDAAAVDERRDRHHWNSPTGSVRPKRIAAQNRPSSARVSERPHAAGRRFADPSTRGNPDCPGRPMIVAEVLSAKQSKPHAYGGGCIHGQLREP